jgi:hypothetical protein
MSDCGLLNTAHVRTLPAPLTRLSWKQIKFLNQDGYVPWELLVDLYADDRIGIAGDELVIVANDIGEVLPFHFCFSQCWKPTLGPDQITFRASRGAIRAVAA